MHRDDCIKDISFVEFLSREIGTLKVSNCCTKIFRIVGPILLFTGTGSLVVSEW